MRLVVALAAGFALSACAGVPSAEQRAASDLNPSGRSYVGPPGVLASTPPADPSFNRLYCRLEGIGTSCVRGPSPF